MRLCKYLLCAVPFLGILGCSDSKVAGNSAETGSPELAGILYLEEGTPAAFTGVHCVPSDFDALKDSLESDYQTTTDDSGAFRVQCLSTGSYSLEAYHEATGQRLLVQDIILTEDSSIAVVDTLQPAGYLLLDLDTESLDGLTGYAQVFGTTIVRSIEVDGDSILVDSLPAGSLNLVIYLNSTNDSSLNVEVNINSKDTTVIWIVKDSVLYQEPEVVDTIVKTFKAPLALPEGDTLTEVFTDIPLVLRLDSTNCNFSDFDSLEGRWEVYRISPDGSRSKALPILTPTFDIEAKTAVFRIKLDSLNVTDTLELIFDTSLTPSYALDVYPPNRGYVGVYVFDDEATDVITDISEKSYYPATGTGVTVTDGVIGSALTFTTESLMEVENSAETDTSVRYDFNFAYDSQFAFSAWVRLDNIKNHLRILGKGDSQYQMRFAPDSGFVVEVFHEAEAYVDSTSDTASYKFVTYGGADLISVCQWVYVSYSKNGNNITFYINDQLITEYAKISWSGTRDESANFIAGQFPGSLDELMVSGSAQNSSWAYATYLNQKPTDYWPVVQQIEESELSE